MRGIDFDRGPACIQSELGETEGDREGISGEGEMEGCWMSASDGGYLSISISTSIVLSK